MVAQLKRGEPVSFIGESAKNAALEKGNLRKHKKATPSEAGYVSKPNPEEKTNSNGKMKRYVVKKKEVGQPGKSK